MKTGIRKLTAGTLIVAVTATPAEAGTIGTENALPSARERILVMLQRPEVSRALEARGVGAEQAKARAAALTDDEAAALVQQIDNAPAGSGGNPAAIVLLPIYVLVGAVRLIALLLGLAFRAL